MRRRADLQILRREFFLVLASGVLGIAVALIFWSAFNNVDRNKNQTILDALHATQRVFWPTLGFGPTYVTGPNAKRTMRRHTELAVVTNGLAYAAVCGCILVVRRWSRR